MIARQLTLLALLALTLLGFTLMVGYEAAPAPGQPGSPPHSSQLQLQFAWSAEHTQAILADWGAAGKERVVRGLYADFLFLAGYAPLLALLACRVARAGAGADPLWRALGRPLAAGQWLAGGLDAAENVILLGMIRGDLDPGLALAVGLMASLKFALVAAGLAYLLAALLAWYGRRA